MQTSRSDQVRRTSGPGAAQSTPATTNAQPRQGGCCDENRLADCCPPEEKASCCSAEDLASADDQALAHDDEDAAALQELASCLSPMLRQLTPAHREALTWADLEGLTQAEAATRAGVSLSGMKSRVQRARKQLKAALERCCRVELDRRGAIAAYEQRTPGACNGCESGD